MKIFKKVFAFAIALTAIAMASSAMAASYDTATYADGKITVASLAATADQTTIAVVDNSFGANDIYSADDIYYIDQDSAAAIIADAASGLGLKGTNHNPASYEVRVGGTGTYDTYTVKKATASVDTIKEQANEDGTKTVGVPVTLNVVAGEGTIQKITFTLNDTTAGITGKTWDWDVSGIANISAAGNVTFGLEITGVPAGNTITATAAPVVAQ